MLRKRLEFEGGFTTEERMIEGKRKSFIHSLSNSYQACDLKKIQNFSNCEEINDNRVYRGLMNPNRLKEEYDEKILSIEDSTGFTIGDIFEWVQTKTKWIIYLEQITEDAYFRGYARRCAYKISFKDEEGNKTSTWAAVRGPSQKTVDTSVVDEISLDKPNYQLNILMPYNEQTKKAFERYSEFIFHGKCWQVKAVNDIDMKNVIEVNATEHYINKETDDMVNEIKDGLVVEPVDPTPNSGIAGEGIILPMIAEKYSVKEEGGDWKILENAPVCISKIDDKTISLIWNKSISGQFSLQWTKGEQILTKVITVESLF